MPRPASKRAMDAVNEALLQPHEYPAADTEYAHPDWFKGTEPEQIKHGSVLPRSRGYSRRAEIKLHDGPQNGGNPNYLQRRHVDEDVKAEIDADINDDTETPPRPPKPKLLQRKK